MMPSKTKAKPTGKTKSKARKPRPKRTSGTSTTPEATAKTKRDAVVNKAIESMHRCASGACNTGVLVKEHLHFVCPHCRKRCCTAICRDIHVMSECESGRAPRNNRVCACWDHRVCRGEGWCLDNKDEHVKLVEQHHGKGAVAAAIKRHDKYSKLRGERDAG